MSERTDALREDISALVDLCSQSTINLEIWETPELDGPTLVLPGHGNEAPVTKSLADRLLAPRTKKSAVRLSVPTSFIDYVNKHRVEDRTELFASLGGMTVSAILDHDLNREDKRAPAVYGRGDNVVALTLIEDADWRLWSESNNELMGQDEFAEFLQQVSHTIAQPDAATIRDIVLKFQATQIIKSERPVHDEQSGSVKFTYENDTQQTGQAKLPGKLTLSLTPFHLGQPIIVEALLRYRFRNGSLTFGFEIVRMDLVKQKAFEALVVEIERGCEQTVFRQP